jgi:hypothetical protein
LTRIDPRIDLQAAAPASPAGRDPAFLSRREGAPRIVLRLSPTLLFLLAAGIAVAAAAVWTALAPWFGSARAVPPALAMLAAGGLSLAAWCRRQSAAIEIGPDSFATWSRAGACLLRGRLTGASQWGSALLALSVQGEVRRATVLIAADAVDRAAFRKLAVEARCAAGR